MERKTKTNAAAKETSLAKATSPFAWFDEVDRWFDSFRRNFEDRFWGGPLARVTGPEAPVREPLVDLTVTSDGIEIRAESKRSREENEKDYFYSERTYQAFQRVLSFPEEVKADLASATLKDGILEVRIPKKEPTPEKKPVKVPVD